MPGREALPGTLKRSPKKAQETWIKTHDSAAETSTAVTASRRSGTAFSAVESTPFEKVGDHWEPKEHKGPSIGRRRRAVGRHGAARRAVGGVDVYGHTRQELYDTRPHARREGRSGMNKLELAQAIARKQD